MSVTGIPIPGIAVARIPIPRVAITRVTVFRIPISRIPIPRIAVARIPIFRIPITRAAIPRIPIPRIATTRIVGPIATTRIPITGIIGPIAATRILGSTPTADTAIVIVVAMVRDGDPADDLSPFDAIEHLGMQRLRRRRHDGSAVGLTARMLEDERHAISSRVAGFDIWGG